MDKRKYIIPTFETISINSKDIITTSDFVPPELEPSSDDDF